MQKIFIAIAATLILAACSKITQDNYNKVQDGMTEQEVQALLGSPSESSGVQAVGLSGTSSKWVGGDATITIRFVNGKVALKSFDKPSAK
ncbi:MAG TPA: outer membrane protein assembly factor BamE [Burkholderiales bacterium]|nr:outer membrane protein assembly factor BamE [Burkholderiales bacterium]